MRLVLALALLVPLVGCGGPSEYAVVGSPRAAGTDGLLQIEEIEGGNRMLTLVLDHLPPPARLGEGMTTYAAWVVPNGGSATKAGNLEYDEDARQGRLMATTPHARFTLKVTAESDAAAVTPSDVVVADREVGAAD
ncbi:MAG: hypothetical protein H6721_23440 [Sandaracinus sp.]|nr:hypothetical protein [Sandaracinus sp.]MCB9616371.1 hypothetical protein [Sandaracinus sp.]MCB9635091.1 hypothetical protein [Sandaracinus sp.]